MNFSFDFSFFLKYFLLFQRLSYLCADGEVRELLQKIGSQAEVVQQSAERVSSTAEVYGAVQQEARIARAVEIMLLHVENLKRMNEREHTELEESRKVLAANNLSVEDQWRASLDVQSPKIGRPNSRGRSVSVIHPKQGSPTNTLGAVLNSPKSRRASVATHQQRQQSPNSNSPNSNSSISFSKVNSTANFGILNKHFY